MSFIIGFDSEDIFGVFGGSSFRGEVRVEVVCSGLRVGWEGRKGGYVVKLI